MPASWAAARWCGGVGIPRQKMCAFDNHVSRCRHHHHAKQAPGWQLTQDLPGHHTWTTPSGRTYTSGPATYPV